MKDKRSTFPLPLSSVTGKDDKRTAYSPAKVFTPQTATRNAAHTTVIKPYLTPARVASRRFHTRTGTVSYFMSAGRGTLSSPAPVSWLCAAM